MAENETAAPKDGEAHCLSCGRFVGTYEVCPYCSASVKKRLPLRVVKWTAVAVALAGLGLLYVAARAHEIERVRVTDVMETMNFAFVRVSGEASSDARVFRQDGIVNSVSFMLDDGSGEIRVGAYGHLAQTLVAQGLTPLTGDRVDVAGSLRIREGDQKTLIVQSPRNLSIEKKQIPKTALSEITDAMLGDMVTVSARVARLGAPREGTKAPYRLDLGDDSGEMTLVAWRNVYEACAAAKEIKEGSAVTVTAEVMKYRGQIQLSLRNAEDLKPGGEPAAAPGEGEAPPAAQPAAPAGPEPDKALAPAAKQAEPPAAPEPPAPSAVEGPAPSPVEGEKLGSLVPPGAIAKEHLGSRVTVEGAVTKVSGFGKGTRLDLSEGGGSVEVMLWNDFVQGGGAVPAKGARVRASGTVKEFKGRLQVHPKKPADLVVLAGEAKKQAAQPSKAPSGTARIKDVKPSMEGQDVTVSGTIVEVKGIKQGKLYVLRDDTGQITVVIWDSKQKYIPEAAKLKKGAGMTVTGRVRMYRSTLEIVPSRGEDVKLK